MMIVAIIAFLFVFGVLALPAMVAGHIAGTLVGKLKRRHQRTRPLQRAQDGAHPPSSNASGWFLICFIVFWAMVVVATVFYLAPQLGWLILSMLGYLALYCVALGVLISIVIGLPCMLWRWWRRSHG